MLLTDGDSERPVDLARSRALIDEGLVLVVLGVDCDQTGPAEVVVPFAVGSEGATAGMIMTTEPVPRGPAVVTGRWGEALVAMAWEALVAVTAGLSRHVGTDLDAAPLIPGALVATSGSITVVTQARHRRRSAGPPVTIELELPEELVDLGAALGLVTSWATARRASTRTGSTTGPPPWRGVRRAGPAGGPAAAGRPAARQPGRGPRPAGRPGHAAVGALASTATGGLYLVVTTEEGDDGAVLGLGARTATLAAPALAATVHVPLVRVGGAGAGFVVGTPEGTIAVAASVGLAGGPAPGGVALDAPRSPSRCPPTARCPPSPSSSGG